MSKNWRYLKDEERIEEGDLGFGMLSNGKYGWGKLPKYLIGQYYVVGWVRHPDIIARYVGRLK